MAKLIYFSKIGKDTFNIEEDETVSLFYISVFDAITNEIEVIACNFEKPAFIKSLHNLIKYGECSLTSSFHTLLIIKANEGGYHIKIDSKSSSFVFTDTKFSPQILLENLIGNN